MYYNKSLKLLLPVAASLALVACSTITTGVSQPFTVNTPKADGAKCVLQDSKGAQWVIEASPMTIEVRKGDGPMVVSCSKHGYKDSEVTVEEGFAGMTLGNVILGGGVGIVVDAMSGAAQEYPDDVQVWLEPKSFVSKEAENEWRTALQSYEDEQEAKLRQLEDAQSNAEYSSQSGNE